MQFENSNRTSRDVSALRDVAFVCATDVLKMRNTLCSAIFPVQVLKCNVKLVQLLQFKWCSAIRGAVKIDFRKNLGFWPKKGGGGA